jgi:hypothetical protein
MNPGRESFDSADPATLEVLRSKTVAERLEIASGMWRSALSDCDQLRIEQEVASRLSHGSV